MFLICPLQGHFKMKILLLGYTGMVGTAVEDVCKIKNINCTGLAHKDLEVTKPDELKVAIEHHKPDIVINSAALVGINQCELEPLKAFDVNTVAVSNMAKICEKNNISLVQISTSAVFDGTKDDFYTEEDLPNLTGIYSASKYASECFVRNICSKHYIIRLPILFGKRRNKGLRFLDKVIEPIKNGEEIRASIDKIDSPTYTIDAANTLISLLEREKPFGLYHIANSGTASYYDFVSKIVEILGVDTKIIEAKDKDFKSLVYNPLKLAIKSIKLKPLRSWQNALHEFITSDLQTNDR